MVCRTKGILNSGRNFFTLHLSWLIQVIFILNKPRATSRLHLYTYVLWYNRKWPLFDFVLFSLVIHVVRLIVILSFQIIISNLFLIWYFNLLEGIHLHPFLKQTKNNAKTYFPSPRITSTSSMHCHFNLIYFMKWANTPSNLTIYMNISDILTNKPHWQCLC